MNKQKFYTGYGLLSVVLMVLLMFSSLPAMAANYGLYIAGTQVTDANCNNLSGITGVTVAAGGEFKYAPETKTLTMKGVTVSDENGSAILNKGIEGLKIRVLGTNSLKTKDDVTLACLASTEIEGNGSLTAISTFVGVYAKVSTLTISNITLEATGVYGILGRSGEQYATLIIKNATVTAKGTTAAIGKFKTFTLEGCQITAPEDGKFDEEKHDVVDAEGNTVKEVKIEPAAAKEYELYIAGTQVTDANCNNLSGLGGVTVASGGEFKYDPATKTLTMKDVTVSVGNGESAIRNVGIAGLTIKVLGTNSLTSTSLSALSCGTFTKIKGSGSLTIASSDNTAIFVNSAPLTISNITLDATGKWGIAGWNAKEDETLIIRNATVTAKGSEAAIADLKTFTLEGCQITAPAGAEWKAEKYAVVDAKGNKAKEVRIEPELYIAGTLVTSLNCNALKDIKGVTVAEGGEFKYDPAARTLTMKGVTVSNENGQAILNKIEGLKIRVLGTNSLKTIDNATLACRTSTEIEGNGSLTVETKKDAAIFANGTTITISNITLEATGVYGIAGKDGNQNETLIIKNAKVSAKGKEAAIADLKTVTLEGCRIIVPEGAEWKAEKKAVVDAKGNVAKAVKIGSKIDEYKLYIAGTQVTDANCDDLSGINGVTVAEGGEFKYDPAAKTLTMQEVTVSVGKDEYAIWNKSIEGLEIVISGSNRLEATDQSPLNCLASTKIEGSGSLTTTSTESSCINIYKTTLTISNITLETTGVWGITGFAGDMNETLIIKKATVTAKGKEAAIAYLKTFTLEGCQIIAPEGAKWKAEKKAVVDADGNIAKEVKIEPAAAVKYELYIAGTQVTDANCNNLKDITGVTVAAGGVFKYDPASKTLTMRDVTVSAEEYKSAIRNNGIEGLKIEVAGTNSLKMKDPGLDCFTSTELKGNGSLTIASASDRAAVFVGGTTLTISDITLEATGAWGIAGNKGDKETLTLKNATVNAKGTAAAICDLKTFTLEGCKIVAPEGAEWKAEEKAIVDAQGNRAKEVKIERAAPVAVTGVKVTPTTVDLKVNETKQLTVTVEPDKATNKNYTCKSDNEGVATVDKTGLVTAVGVGTATITITTEDGGKTITCSVNVTESGTPTFALNPTTLNVPAAGGAPSVNVTSDKAWTLDYDSSVTWLKASPKAGTGNGTVTFTVAKNEASAPRTVMVTFKQAEKELKLTLTQESASSAHVPLIGISFDEPNLKLKVGTSATLVVKYNPENATNKKVTWEVTEGAASLSVDENGTITATNVAGTAKVKATSAEGSHTAECTITVTTEDVPVESIAVSPAVVNLTVDGTQRLSVSVNPRTATNQTATWAVTSGADVVSVDGSGLVRALKEGTATVTATVGGKTATCTVTVTAAPIAPLAVEDAVLASLVIAPNPFTSQLRIVNPEGIALRYELVTLTGNVVRAGALDGTETVVDTEALPAGLYFVRFYAANSSKRSVKVIKY